MDFLKKHYEKVVLGLVLLGLAVAVGFLPFKIASDQQELEAKRDKLINPKVQPLTNLDMTLPDLALKRVATPAVINFGLPNRLFNPKAWQKTSDGRLVPQDKVGPNALTVTNITPLNLVLTLDKVDTSENGAKYMIGIEKPGPVGNQKIKTQEYCTINPPTKNKTFSMVEVKGTPEDPQVVVQLNDTSERAVISTNKPFRRVEGYMADLRYDLEKKFWDRKRINATLTFNGEEYKIVAINHDEVVLSAPNQKKWTIRSAAAP